MKLTNKDNSINPHSYFTMNKGKNKGKKLRVIGTEIQRNATIDIVKNLATGKCTKVMRKELIKLDANCYG